MATTLLDGRALGACLRAELTAKAQAYLTVHVHLARLSLVLAGAHPAARLYSNQVARSCAEIGLECLTHTYPASITSEELRAAVATLSATPSLSGLVVLLPLPEHIRQRTITEVIAPEKDVDGLGPQNAVSLVLGFPSFIPGTAAAVRALLGGNVATEPKRTLSGPTGSQASRSW